MLFKDIPGHTEIKKRLIRTVREQRVSHAQLFLGPEGNGKTALAIAYAQFINCKNKDFGDDEHIGDSCGHCPSCLKYQKLAHPDLHFIYPVATTRDVKSKPVSKNFIAAWRQALLENDFLLNLNDWYETIGIEKKQGYINAEECSEILRTLSYTSYESEYKVMIIWMVENLYHSAAPKILKILEEPPDKTLFILISENQDQIINTILSRTQIIKIPKLDDEKVKEVLTERYGASPEDAAKAAIFSSGNLLKARRYLNDTERFSELQDQFISWMRMCYGLQIKELINFIQELSRLSREKQKHFLLYASEMLRNAFMVNIGQSSLSRMSKKEEAFLEKFSAFVHSENIGELSEMMEKAHYHIERNANPNLTFMDLSLRLYSLLRQPRPVR